MGIECYFFEKSKWGSFLSKSPRGHSSNCITFLIVEYHSGNVRPHLIPRCGDSRILISSIPPGWVYINIFTNPAETELWCSLGPKGFEELTLSYPTWGHQTGLWGQVCIGLSFWIHQSCTSAFGVEKKSSLPFLAPISSTESKSSLWWLQKYHLYLVEIWSVCKKWMFESFSGNNGKTPADLRGSTERLCKCTSYCFSKGLYAFTFFF